MEQGSEPDLGCRVEIKVPTASDDARSEYGACQMPLYRGIRVSGMRTSCELEIESHT